MTLTTEKPTPVDYETPITDQVVKLGLKADPNLLGRIDPDLSRRHSHERLVRHDLVEWSVTGIGLLSVAARREANGRRGANWQELLAFRTADQDFIGTVYATNATVIVRGKTHCAMLICANGSSELTSVPMQMTLEESCHLLEIVTEEA